MFFLRSPFIKRWLSSRLGLSEKHSSKGGEARQAVTLITGATEGLGRTFAHELALYGHALVLIARTGEALLETGQALKKTAPELALDIHLVAADLSTMDGIEKVCAYLESHNLSANFLINNAATAYSGNFIDQPLEECLRMIDLNIGGLTALSQRLLPQMIDQGAGGILNIASIAGLTPGPYQAVYYASKAYVISLTEALAHEVQGSGVHIAVAAPGPIATKLHARMKSENDFYLRFLGVMTAERVAQITLLGFALGRRLIVPGVFNLIAAYTVHLVPHFILVPVIGWLLARRASARP